MTASPDQDTLLIAYVYGELTASAARTFEERLRGDPALQAEVDGMVATRDLLEGDIAFGQESGLDDPPPHLFDAILRAEALSRPPEIRAAIVHAARPPEEPLLKRLTMWLLGGGAALGAAAAAVLFLVTSGDTTMPESPSVAVDEMLAKAESAKPTAEKAMANKKLDRASAPTDLEEQGDPRRLRDEGADSPVQQAPPAEDGYADKTQRIQDAIGDGLRTGNRMRSKRGQLAADAKVLREPKAAQRKDDTAYKQRPSPKSKPQVQSRKMPRRAMSAPALPAPKLAYGPATATPAAVAA